MHSPYGGRCSVRQAITHHFVKIGNCTLARQIKYAFRLDAGPAVDSAVDFRKLALPVEVRPSLGFAVLESA